MKTKTGEHMPLSRKRKGSFKIDELQARNQRTLESGEEAVKRTLRPRQESKVVHKRSTAGPDKLN